MSSRGWWRMLLSPRQGRAAFLTELGHLVREFVQHCCAICNRAYSTASGRRRSSTPPLVVFIPKGEAGALEHAAAPQCFRTYCIEQDGSQDCGQSSELHPGADRTEGIAHFSEGLRCWTSVAADRGHARIMSGRHTAGHQGGFPFRPLGVRYGGFSGTVVRHHGSSQLCRCCVLTPRPRWCAMALSLRRRSPLAKESGRVVRSPAVSGRYCSTRSQEIECIGFGFGPSVGGHCSGR